MVEAVGAGPIVMEEGGSDGNESKFWGNDLKNRDGCLRVVYNNCNGMQVKAFLQTKARQTKERKVNKMLQNPIEITKVATMMDILRSWEANFI